MESTLKDSGITATVKQIGKKLTDQKNYHGAQKRTTESSKSSGVGADEVYVSKPLEVLRTFRIFKRRFHSSRMIAHPLFTQNLLPLKHPRSMLWRKIMTFLEL